MRHLNIKKYLLETNIGDSSQNIKQNENVFGAVLAYNAKIKEANYNEPGSFKEFNLISLLLFLNFRTGRVERYIINSSNPTMNLNRKNIGVDYKKDLYFTWNNEKYKVFHDWDHGDDRGETILSILGDGKMSSKYYLFFINELIRDYFRYFGSYKNGNIASLRKLTFPIEAGVMDNTGIKIGLGVGMTNEKENLPKLIKESKIYKDKEFISYNAYNWIENGYGNVEPTKDNKLIIFIPNGLKNAMIENFLYDLNYKVIYTNKGELSQLVQDFSRTLSIKTVKNVDDIVMRIKSFNYNIVKQLERMGKESRHKVLYNKKK
jgi:hypothetical protein